jgi:mannosylglycerate hydrolase
MHLHLVSHTHWDREWYLTFQQFRLRLVYLVDNLIDLLTSNPDYRNFTLDGQTIILEDYLEIRPEREVEIRELVQSGRLLIGPWYILPDEFLVSPEATVRNLLEGDRTSQRFGNKMEVGYLPDPFGHISQMPQILKGFGLEAACLQRGLDIEPTELWWEAPDGSRVFLVYLRDGYGNAAGLPVSDPEMFLKEICRLRDSLLAFSAAGKEGAPTGGHLLLMQGTDHMAPLPETPSLIDYGNEYLNRTKIIHSSLPKYLKGISDYINNNNLEIPTITGELRSSRRFHLLPGVYSSRMWIKQRNFTCETLLEKWAEPFSAWAQIIHQEEQRARLTGFEPVKVKNNRPVLRYAWRQLMTCHPHDSICGCSIDQVHDEMRSRFDQVEQVGEELAKQSLAELADAVDTRLPSSKPVLALVVFNPSSNLRTDSVCAEFPADWDGLDFAIVDDEGHVLSHRVLGSHSKELMDTTIDTDSMRSLLASAQDGRVGGLAIRSIAIEKEGEQVFINVQVSETLEPAYNAVLQTRFEIEKYLDDPGIRTFSISLKTETEISVLFAPQNIPPLGWKTYWIVPPENHSSGKDTRLTSLNKPHTLETQNLTLEFDTQNGWFNLLDKKSKTQYTGLNKFIDGGDCGDEYNYCPPEKDRLIDNVKVKRVEIDTGAVCGSITAEMSMDVPSSLTKDRSARSQEMVNLSIKTTATLTEGLSRVDFHTWVDNCAEDHRLRVFFPAPFQVEHAHFDGHFEVVRRPVKLPNSDDTWIEAPRPEAPQRCFTSIYSSNNDGLAVSNRGLPEAAVYQNEAGGSEIALTLLRCTGWLSRGDLSTRKGHAGPRLPTPGAQELGVHKFEYAFLPDDGEDRSVFFQKARNFSVPLRAVSTRIHPGDLPGNGSFVKVEPDDIEVSIVKLSENSESGSSGWVIRGYNQNDKDIQITITPFRRFPYAARVDLAERHLADLEVEADGSITFSVGGHEIFTVFFRGNS